MVSFIGEFMVLLGAFQQYMWVGALATVGIVLTAAYVLRVYQKSMTGPLNPECEGMKDLNGREITALVPIAALILVLGVFPAPLLNVINPAVDRLMTTVGVSDPEVTFPLSSVPVSSEGGSE